ncbi:bifunctional N(6)-L-threonylcarbamoyladenine synthase/serine/threonine protein kinase [Candidatus Woesearchaeota archaeon]|nr:bifunctional N(6)-L-threonylcarbamoyladenine synthase/serine/threonine protein kinase [Candidatus Woesearchaeota archaeon]
MICLGIESTAHTFGAAVIKDKKILSNIKKILTTETGGIVPQKAAEHHVEQFDSIIKDALEKAGLKIKDIDLIAFSNAPGLGHTLRIGAHVARSLAIQNDIPIVGVNHCIAHLEIGKLMTKAKDPVLLYASGANTQVIAFEGGKYRVFGETLDIGIGNFIDTFARHIGLGFPGGPKLEKVASLSKKYVDLPYNVKGMDVSFTGILTKLKRLFDEDKHKTEDLVSSMQETVFAMLLEVSERAMAHCGKKELLLGGGVACNKRLQEMAQKMCEERGAKCFVLENQYNVDNAAMIAHLGLTMYKGGVRHDINVPIDPYERTADVAVTW